VFIEYCMLAGVNDSAECVRRPFPLSQHAWQMLTHAAFATGACDERRARKRQ
jgi:hypothetical protein